MSVEFSKSDQFMNNISKQQSGFTLIEIMVVVVILGILGALIVPNIISKPDEARVATARGDIRAVGSALDFYLFDNSNYPSTEQGLEALVSRPSGYPEPRNWNRDGYLKKIPVDPWGEPYLYFSEGPRHFEVYSFGADRKEGGEGVEADIYYSEL
ncbi:MAG: type II secretion system major pseudopilin GspG [Pseudomonadales bacterium]